MFNSLGTGRRVSRSKSGIVILMERSDQAGDTVLKGVAREIDSWNLDLTQFIGETKIGPVSTFFRSIRSSDKESCEVFIRNISIDVTLHKTRSYSVDRQEH